MEREKVRQILLKSTAFSDWQTEKILDTKNDKGKSFLDALSEGEKTQSLTPESTLSLLCEHLKLPFLNEIPAEDIPSNLVSSIPINYAKTRSVLPLRETSETVEVLTSNPLNFEVLTDLKIKLKKSVQPVVSFHHKVQEAINRVYERTTQDFTEFEDIKTEEYDLDDSIIDLLETDDEAPVIKLVNTMLARAVKERASDIHVEPYEKSVVFRFRIDGALHSVLKVEKRLQNIITSRIKIMGNLNIAEKRLPQDGNIFRRLAGKEIDIRLSAVPTVFGERLVLRLQDRSQGLLKIDQLGIFRKQSGTFKGAFESNLWHSSGDRAYRKRQILFNFTLPLSISIP